MPVKNSMSSNHSATKASSSIRRARAGPAKAAKRSTSSSRRKSAPSTDRDHSHAWKCVTCGRKAVVRQTVMARNNAGDLVAVEAEVCGHCGERYYDLPAMRVLEIGRG